MWRFHILAVLSITMSLSLSLPSFLPFSIDQNAKDSMIKREEIIDKLESDTFSKFAKNFSLAEKDTQGVNGTACVEVMESCKTDTNCCGDEIVCKRKMCKPKHYTKIDVID